MSLLRLFPDDLDPTRFEDLHAPSEIADVAARAGVKFERWQADAPLGAEATPAAILAGYAAAVERLSRERGFVTADVIAVTERTPDHPRLRAKFLDEHVHSEDEARFFVDGRGLFSVHHGGAVYALLCERGDLINVPAGTAHWFDMGPSPRFQCIRLFSDPAGWVAELTGSDLAARFPRLDSLP
jgi:1,2-dihydroxy-3-keto-5-methylthiopentene dioxygenase